MSERSQAVTERDPSGLTMLQRKTLGALAATPDMRTALAEAGVKPYQLTVWLRRDHAFRKAFDDMFSDAVEAGRSILGTLLPKAAETVGEALDANEPTQVDVQCPECDHCFKVSVQAPRWNTRMRAAEDVLKREGELVEVHRHEGQVTHLTLEQQVALHALKRGVPLPPALREELESLGLVEPPSSTPSTPSDHPEAELPLPDRTDTSETVDAPHVRDVSDEQPPPQESDSSPGEQG